MSKLVSWVPWAIKKLIKPEEGLLEISDFIASQSEAQVITQMFDWHLK